MSVRCFAASEKRAHRFAPAGVLLVQGLGNPREDPGVNARQRRAVGLWLCRSRDKSLLSFALYSLLIYSCRALLAIVMSLPAMNIPTLSNPELTSRPRPLLNLCFRVKESE